MRLHPAWTCSLLPVLAAPSFAGTFEDLGIPVTKAGNMGILVGPNRDDTKDLVYLNYMQAGAPLFVLSVDPDSGETHQYPAPQESGGWAFVLGPDKKVYVGTFGEGLILRFDPAKPDGNVTIVGKPSATESYVWQLVVAPDGKLYGCTYPQAKLVTYDPATGKLEDLGRMDPVEMYSRTLAAAPNGKIYTGVGPTRQGLVVYDPKTREHRELLPENWRINNFITVYNGADGNVYAGISHPGADGKTVSETFRLDDETLVPVTAVPGKTITLRDGREIIGHAEGNKGGSFQVRDPKSGESRTVTFEYQGAGSVIFMVGAGPGDSVYGSTAMPLEVFRNDPAHGSEHLGNMPGGEVYSLLPYEGKVYLCYYGGSIMNLYDPAKPGWKYGPGEGDNPRTFGGIGDGHLRPRAMIYGPDQNIYIGSHPAYGQLGGAMAVWDPRQNKTVENYRNLVQDQSIVALAWEPKSGLIFGGSGNYGGGGSTATQKEAMFFAFDPVAKKKVLELALVPGAQTYEAMAAAEGKVFVAVGSKLIVWDAAKGEQITEAALPGGQLEICLGLHKDGLLYGLCGKGIYSVDPRTYAIQLVATPPVPVTCGFALNDQGIYFGSGVHLWRYRW